MDDVIARVEEWVGLSRADLLGLAVALVGCVVATLVALRVPLLEGGTDGGPAPSVSAADGTGQDGPVLLATDLVVHVAGAVAQPGVVTLAAGSRVGDALAAAGGARADAVLDGLNLARPLTDGEQVLVPVAGAASSAGDAAAPATADTVPGRLPDGRIDLNTADAVTLDELPGVGPVLAERIIAHRTEHGPFTAAADLRAVSGIGEATWLRLRDLVGVR